MFKLVKKIKNGIRIGELTTAHGVVQTPFFMPVATQGSVKGIACEEIAEIGFPVVLSNTYHLYLRPGEQLIKKMGGLQKFMNWDGPILTDSGGYQVFSLAKNNFQFPISNFQSNPNNTITKNNRNGTQKSLVKITDNGVEFTSHLDGSKHLFTPEKVIDIQLDLGVDILMPLDVCPSGKATKEEIKKACEITLEWAHRSKLHFERKLSISNFQFPINDQINEKCKLKNEKLQKRPLLHGIVQGGLYEDLRRWHTQEMIKLDFDGYSVGGLAVDHETRDMWEVVKLMGEILPENKQRYLMGVGTPDDILKAMSLGMDMFDCVLPTRLGRHGAVFIRKQSEYQLVNLLNSKFKDDGGVIEKGCGCYACKNNYSRAYISHLLRAGEINGARFASLHNLWVYRNLTKNKEV